VLASYILSDIEQVKNEKKSFTFRWILRQKTLAYSGKGQQWRRSMWNV
jgi:phosphoribosylaminoimidazole carboxylase (NCAIR synthetase)